MKNLQYSFSVEHAEKYGLNEAIMIHNFMYWIKINQANNNNFINGRHWTYNSSKAFQKLFPFWTQKQIEYTLSKMVDTGILIKDCFNEDKRDRTGWYTLADDFFSNCISEKKEMDVTNLGNDISEKKEMIYIPDKKQQIKNTNQNNIDTASGLSQNENPTVKDSLQVQKPKKEDDFEQAWLFWKDLCKNKGSQTGEKKPAKIQYEKVLKKVKQDDIMRVLKAFNDYIQIAFENNKNFERWIKSANWDNIDEAVADYKQQESNRKKELIKDGKPLPLPQKTTMEAEKEVIDTNALIELRNAKYNALTQDRQKASDEIRDFLLTYFGTVHHEWINSSLWHQQTIGNNEVDLHIGIFSESKRKVIELNAEKIMDKLLVLNGKIVNKIIIKVIK